MDELCLSCHLAVPDNAFECGTCRKWVHYSCTQLPTVTWHSKSGTMPWDNTLPLKSVVLFVACGTLLFIIVFIFAKRQITRFALKSNRSPHVPIGSDVPKRMKVEIDRRLNRIRDIKYEPQLLSNNTEELLQSSNQTGTYQFYYRMKAVDAVALLDTEFKNFSVCIKRGPHQSLRMFLLDQRYNGPLDGIEINVIENFIQAYNHARHQPQEFCESHYRDYMLLLNQLINHIRARKSSGKGISHHRVDSRTATTPDEIHPQLDPTPILTPLPKQAMSTQPSSSHSTSRNAALDSNPAPSVVYAVCSSSTASLTSSHFNEHHKGEVVTLVSRHSSKSSLSARPGETHV